MENTTENTNGGAKEFKEVATLRDPDGLVAVITERARSNGRMARTVSFFKEYDRMNVTARTTWIERRHLDSLRRLVDKVEREMDLFEDRERAALRTVAK